HVCTHGCMCAWVYVSVMRVIFVSWHNEFVANRRFISTHVDVSPTVLADLERLLRTEDSVVRFFSLKQNTKMSHVGSLRKDNPFRPDTVSSAHSAYDYPPP